MEDLNRKMPVSIEAEQALLGSLILRPSSFEKIGGMIKAEDFDLVLHQHMFAAIERMFNTSATIDPITLVNTMIEMGDKDETSGPKYIDMILGSVPSAANIEDYAKIVKEKALLRSLIRVCEDIESDAYEGGAPVRQMIDVAEQRIFDLSHGNTTKDFRHISTILQNVFQELEIKSEHKGDDPRSVKTGFSGLDRVLVEMGSGDLVIVGARPGMGKTSFAMNIATNVAKQSKKSVCIFSLEMSGEQLVTRILSSEALVDSYALRSGQLKPEDWDSIAGVVTDLSGCNIYIDDTSAMTTTEMKSKLRRIPNLGLVVIDYIGLMQSTINTDNRAVAVGEISRNLKIMAKDLGVPFIVCAQLNRGTESRSGQDKKPNLSDLRDSGSIEQDADIVMFLYRDEYYKEIGGKADDPEANKKANTAEVIVAKNRHGSVKNVTMGWIGQFTKFRTLEEDR